MKSGVYEIINLVNGKRYVGSAVNISERRGNHFSQLGRGCHHNKHLQAAFSKYGASDFEFRVALICEPQLLIQEEQARIDSYPANMLYNKRKIAQSCLGIKHSAETRKRMSEAQRGHSVSEEARRRMSVSQTGKKQPIEVRQKRSESLKGHQFSEASRNKISAALKAFYTCPEARKRCSDRTRTQMSNPAHRRRVAESKHKPYPSFTSPQGVVYPPGIGISPFCAEHGLSPSRIRCLIQGGQQHHKGWTLTPKQPT